MNKIVSNLVSRRNILKVGAGFLGTSSLAAAIGLNLTQTEPAAAQNRPLLLAKTDLTPDQAFEELMRGNRRFVENKRENPHQALSRLGEVSMGQSPFAAILGCADSRFPSEIVFDQGIGDLFVCRVAGNLATDEEIGSLEFGTQILGAKVIMVVGHERCGAVKAALDGGRYPGRISTLTDSIQLAVERSLRMSSSDDKFEKATKANVSYQVEKLQKSPIIGQLVDSGQLKVVGGYYDLDSGEVSLVS